ncbi:hypothetical protein [Halosimplex amylolyticum]|uniref:hypothetical protein n=1 Tax=Halosimplex amylolyticum TaxID=3396616 RepID=UPI003F579B0D
MTSVSTADGIAYGFKTTLSFGLGLLVAFVCALAGTNMATGSVYVGYGGWEVLRWGRLLVGVVLSVAGFLALSGVTFGLLYKVVADGVERGGGRGARRAE